MHPGAAGELSSTVEVFRSRDSLGAVVFGGQGREEVGGVRRSSSSRLEVVKRRNGGC